MNRSANAIARHCGAALAVAVAVAALGPAGAADAVPTAPLILVAPALGAASPADPDVVAEAVSQALEDLPGDPIAVKPAAADAPAAAEAPLLDQSEGVAVLDAAPVGQAELSLDQAGGRVAVLVTDALATDDFSVAGVTWEDGPDPGRVLARAYQDDGWTEWFELDAADGPDPASAEGRRARAGTEPLVAAGSTAVQIQVLSAPGGELPAGLAPAVVPLDPGEVDPDPSSAGQTDAVAGGGPGASAPLGQTLGASTTASNTQPTVNPRSKWNAAPADYSGNTPKGQPVLADKLSGAIIHHQAGSNVYTEAQVPGVIRSIQSWHMGNNGWDDIGYNFLVDKYGGIWEGREGGIDQNVVGAHAFEFNTGTTGVCFLGSMETAQPSAAALDAAGRLVAWRLGLAGIASLKGQTVYPNDPLKQSKPIVAGHRDVNATTCPGRYLYAKLDFIRSYQPIPALTRRVAQSVLSPDLDGDGRGEILAVDDLGALLMFPMTSATQLGPAVQIGSGWTGYTLLAPGDWNGDGIGDLMSVDPAGRLILYPGDGELGFSSQRIGWGWTGYAPTVSPDLDGDGCPDILAIKLSSHVLYLYRGDGKGGFKQSAGQRVGSGWQGWELHAAGDLGGDKLGDIFGVSPDGLLYSYQGVKGGGFGPRARVGSGWNGWRLMAGADLTGDSRPDIAGLEKTKRFVNVYEWLKAGWFAAPVQVAEDW